MLFPMLLLRNIIVIENNRAIWN